MTNPNDPAEMPLRNTPQKVDCWCTQGYLTKKELFTVMAMQALISKRRSEIGWMKKCAIHSVQMADALIAELNKGDR